MPDYIRRGCSRQEPWDKTALVGRIGVAKGKEIFRRPASKQPFDASPHGCKRRISSSVTGDGK